MIRVEYVTKKRNEEGKRGSAKEGRIRARGDGRCGREVGPQKELSPHSYVSIDRLKSGSPVAPRKRR